MNGTFHPDSLRRKTALVVGGTCGIGAAIAAALADLRAVRDRDAARPKLKSVAAQRAAGRIRCRDAVALDVRDDAAIRARSSPICRGSMSSSTAPALSGAAPSTTPRFSRMSSRSI